MEKTVSNPSVKSSTYVFLDLARRAPINRPYFYRDTKGNIKKYHYCSRCPSGPFKEDDYLKAFITLTSQDYCIECLKTVHRKEVWEQMLIDHQKMMPPPAQETPASDIVPGQIWEDKDKRRPGRRLTIKEIEGDHAICELALNNKTTKIGLKRFREGRFQLVV